MQTIMDFNAFQVNEDTWISNLAKNPGLAMLSVNGFGKLVLLHNMSYLHENIFCSEAKVLGLCGNDSQAEVYRDDLRSASTSLELPVPTWRDLKGLQPGTDLDSIVVPDQNPPVARFKNSLWIPPLILTTMLEVNSLDPAVLIPALSLKFQEFDKSSTSIKACTILRPVLEYLWATSKKLVPPTISAVEGSSDAVDWSSRLHFAYICAAPLGNLPPPFPVPPAPGSTIPSSPFRLMTDELRKIREANEKQMLTESQAAESKKDSSGWDKLPDMIQNMVL